MSWAEVFKINSNMTKPLNTLISELISGVTTLLNTVSTNVTTVNTNVTNTKTQVGTVNTTVNTINTNVSSIKTSVTSLGTQLTNVNNMVKDSRFLPMRVITTTGTYTPEKTGTYKVICVGAGGDGGYGATSSPGGGGGGGGGVAIKDIRLVRGTNYNVTVSTTASFAAGTTTISATRGGSGTYSSGGSGGTASGGDYNYPGTAGSNVRAQGQAPTGGSVGVVISGLTTTPPSYFGTLIISASDPSRTYNVNFVYGDCILNYGGGGTGAGAYATTGTGGSAGYATDGKPAAVIIIPLEMEE